MATRWDRGVKVYDWVFRAFLQRMDAERAHRLSFGALRAIAAVPGGTRLLARVCRAPESPVDALGLLFPSPLGLAAGFDKDADGIDALAALGFGFVEVGTVTAQPQPGNPKPRLFRLPRDRAVVNRLGFNNTGADAVARRLRRRHQRGRGSVTGSSGRDPAVGARSGPSRLGPVVGVNIGKTRLVPDADAIADYVASTRQLAPFADYLVVNVSSPNTPGLRDLQAVETLRPLLVAVGEAADDAAGRHVPLLVKIAPDLADDDIGAIADLAGEIGLAGIVATNTTITRDGLTTPAGEVDRVGAGGLSGPPLRQRSLDVLKLLRSRVSDDVALISVGGIDSAEEAAERLRAGATLVQAYTALIYGGPWWPSRLRRALAADVADSPKTQTGAGKTRKGRG